MASEKERMALQKKIMELDRQMGEEVESKKGRVPRVVAPVGFPWALYTLAVLVYAASMFGGQFLPAIATHRGKIAIASYVIAGLAVLKTLVWASRKIAARKARGYTQEDSDRIHALRKQRDELQKRLRES